MNEREQEINLVLSTITELLKQYNLTLTAYPKKKCLIVVDSTTGKRYGIKAVE